MMLITIIVAWLIVGNINDAVNIGVIANVLKTFTYYTYERAWDHVSWYIQR